MTKISIFILLVVATLLCALQLVRGDEDKSDPEWNEWKQRNGKAYKKVETEKSKRLQWQRNMAFIKEHNAKQAAGKATFKVAMNEYGDLSGKEFAVLMKGLEVDKLPLKGTKLYKSPRLSRAALPSSIDWRTLGAVTPVKDQKACGSCWAISAAGAIEGQWFRKNRTLVSLSAQNLIDCSSNPTYGNKGCLGGNPIRAMLYVYYNPGINTDKDYPYWAGNGACSFNRLRTTVRETNVYVIAAGDEATLTQALAQVGPISVMIDSSQPSFQFYKSGVYSSSTCSSTKLDHAVLAVGYGTDIYGRPYYIVKNSWGSSWGLGGYIYMSRNNKNNCGIATAASFPTV